ncbi:MAG: hypothetical protein FJ087_20445 [Deltaproteobacteria bacterium]|nr:hypothetical protein [Deltaproteobacteria bacterium]
MTTNGDPLFCPLCGKRATYEHNLRVHLKGLCPAGHELEGIELEEAVRKALANVVRRTTAASPAVVRRRDDKVVPVGLSPSAAKPTPAVRAPAAPVTPIHPTPAPVLRDLPFLEDVFRTLVENKALPKYQFERRVDVLLSMFLPEALSRLLGGDIRIVAPEFPLARVCGDMTCNMDYLLFRHAARAEDERWLLLELKTDTRSLDRDQIERYKTVAERGMPWLLGEVGMVRSSTKFGGKYDALARRVEHLPAERPVEWILLAPEKPAIDLGPSGRVVTFAQLAGLDLSRHPAEWTLFRNTILRRAWA